MRRIHTTFDLLEAHILTGLLREHDIGAWLFDADFVRQDWFKMIAYGGYRILVRDEDVAAARDVLRGYYGAALALDGEHDASCPQCGKNTGMDDPQPRRHVFLAIIALSIAQGVPFIFLQRMSAQQILVAFLSQFVLACTLPWIVTRYFKWRLRCSHCAHRWREPPRRRYAELARLAATGEASTS